MLHAIERVHGGGPRFTGQLRTARTAGLRRTFALQHRPGMAKVRPKRAFASAPRASEFPPLMMWAVAIAASIGAGTGCIVLTSQGGYALDRLRSPQSQMWPTLKAVVLAASAVITCLFLANAEAPPFRAFPFAFMASALLLLAGFRLGLRSLFRRWTKAGYFRRRIAVVAVNDFSQEFIERLQAEPDAFEIVGVYDDRLPAGRVSSLHANTRVRGTVADLVRDSREENVDVIAVALPLSAVQRISTILEQLSSTVADVCLTTDLAGLRRHRARPLRSRGRAPAFRGGAAALPKGRRRARRGQLRQGTRRHCAWPLRSRGRLPHSRPTEPGTNRQIVLAGYNSRSVNRAPRGREKSLGVHEASAMSKSGRAASGPNRATRPSRRWLPA